MTHHRYYIEDVIAPQGKQRQRRVLVAGSSAPSTMREYRRWASDSNMHVELIARLRWDKADAGDVSHVSGHLGGKQYAIEFQDDAPGFGALRRPAGAEEWEAITTMEPQDSIPEAMAHLEALLQVEEIPEEFDSDLIAKAIAGFLLTSGINIEESLKDSLLPYNVAAVQEAMRRLGEKLTAEAGEFARLQVGCRLVPKEPS